MLILIGERRGDVNLDGIHVYYVSDRVDWRDLESVQLGQARQGERR